MRRLPVISSVLLPQPPKAFSPSAGQIVLSPGLAPSVRLPINPGSAALSLSASAPTLGISPGFVPDAGAIDLAANTPVISIASGLTLTPAVGSLVLSGAAPVSSVAFNIVPTAASLTLSGDAPTETIFVPFDPSQLASLVDWYDASDSGTITDDGSGKASQWNSKSSNANNMTQGTSGSRPTITAAGINGLNTLTFSGSQSMANGSCIGLPDNSAGYIIACVIKESTAAGQIYIVNSGNTLLFTTDASWFGIYNNGALVAAQAVASVGTGTNVLSGVLNASIANVYLNGTVGSFSAGGYSHNFTGNTTAGLGSLLNGQEGEIVVTSGTSTSDRQKLEGYLAWKWGTVSLLPIGHPYKSAAP